MRVLETQELIAISGGVKDPDLAPSPSMTIAKVIVDITSAMIGLVPIVGPIISDWLRSPYAPEEAPDISTGQYFVAQVIDNVFAPCFGVVFG